MGASGVSKSQVSRLCVELDERVGAFLSRPIEGEWPLDPLCGSSWLDATYVKVRQAGRIVSVAATIAVAVNTDGRREVLGMASGASEAETFWADFLRSLARRGLRGVKLVISDSHEGLKAAVARVLHASWQRCRVPSPGFMPGVPSGTDRSLFTTDHAQRPGARRQGSSPPRLGLDRHRLRRSRSRSQAVAQRRRPTPSPGAQAPRPDGQRRSRCAGVHDVPQGHGPRSTAPIRWSASTARSSAAPTSSLSSRTKLP